MVLAVPFTIIHTTNTSNASIYIRYSYLYVNNKLMNGEKENRKPYFPCISIEQVYSVRLIAIVGRHIVIFRNNHNSKANIFDGISMEL